MAKARAIEGLAAEDPYAAAGAKIVAVRSREVADHSHDVLDVTDIERVHDMRVATRRLRAALEIFEPCFPAEQLADNAARIVRVRLEEMRSFAPRALEPRAVRAQHDMRIAAKRLRYVLEATEFCFGRPAEVARRRARDLQDVLGELHDCDVMLPRVERHLAGLRQADAAAVRERAGNASDLEPALAARAPHRTSYRGLEILIVYLHARRA